MKRIFACAALLWCAALLAGCVHRTVTSEPEHRGATRVKKPFGSDPHAKVLEKKTVWIWQEEFRNPK